MENYDIAVIGGGPAGITLAKMLGAKKKMAVIRPEDHSMIYCAMPYAIEGLLDEKKTLKKDSLVTDAGADLIRNTVASIDFEAKRITFENSSQIGWDKLVIATGADPFIPPIPGKDLAGVTGFKTANDMSAITKIIDAGLGRAVVVGAGAIGIELALAIKARGVEVDLVDMGESILPNLVDREMSEEPCSALAGTGIRLHLQAKVTELKSGSMLADGKQTVSQVILDNGQIIHFDSGDECAEDEEGKLPGLVVFATGMTPQVSIVKDSGMKLGRDGIIVNEKMETSIPDVFAAGDCVEFTSGITKKPVPGKLATNAVPMARIVAFNLLGKPRTYPGFYNGAATRVGDYYVGGTGLSEKAAGDAGIKTICGYGEVTTQFPIMPEAKKMRTKLVVERDTRRLIGAQIVSGEPVTGRLDLLTFAIQKESTVDDLAALSYSAQPYQSFYPAANGIVMAAEDIIRKLSVGS
ncbi:MAG: FAD-dependent oxidoreductase [Candidatus Krumholzibacteria bacterium]|nr:FAD-dependent oxidoreductase [Candidatus Krumholzibacteria bacterium]